MAKGFIRLGRAEVLAFEETLGETLEMLAFNRDLLTNAKLAIANTIHANHSWRNNIFSYVGILNLLSQR